MDPRNRVLVTAGVMGSIFIAALDTTVVAAAMKSIADELQGHALYSWPFATYMVASTATVPLYGRLADSFGRKRLFFFSIGAFLLGSLLCGAAPSMEFLVAARLVQGIGAGGILPLALTIAGDLYGPEARARIQALFSSVWAVAAVLGPVVGGGIVETIGWRWIFLLNLPFGAIAALLIHRFHRERAREGAPGRPDFLGAAMLTAGLGALLVALLGVGDSAWGLAGAALALTVILAAAFVRSELRAEHPLVDTALLRIRIVAASNAVGFLSGGILFALAAFVPLWVGGVLGGSAIRAGFALTPMSFGWVTGAFLTGRLVTRIGYRLPTIFGLLALTVSSAFFALLRPGSPAIQLVLAMGGAGLGLGFAFTATLVGVQNAVGRNRLGQATSSVHLFRSIGGVFGVSVAGCIHLAGLKAVGGPVDAVAPADLAPILGRVFAACLAFAAAALVAGLFMPRGRRIASDEARADQDGGWPERAPSE